MNIRIRRANTEDLETMLAWRGHSSAMREAIAYEFGEIPTGLRTIFLAFADIQLVGTVQMLLEHEDADLIRDAAHLQALEVHHDFQRRGIASRLNKTLMAEAKRLGCSKVTLMVEPENAAARALYTKLGFRVFKTSTFVWDSQVLPVLCMERSI
jgi:ribosomal protein S18 acetylase RimI-like enzyme